MQNNDIKKKKNELFKSIMTNPKLARTLKEAMAAPIGSTKREQAKSILSIMNKLGGVGKMGNDGMGGPIAPTPALPNVPSMTSNSGTNYMFFSAAPKLKVDSSLTVDKGGIQGAGSNNSNLLSGSVSNFNTAPTNNQPTTNALSGATSYKDPFKNVNEASPISGNINNLNPGVPDTTSPFSGSGISPDTKASGISQPTGEFFDINKVYGSVVKPIAAATPTSPLATTTPTSGAPSTGTDTNNPEDVKKLQDALVKAGYMTQAEVNSGYGIYGPKTQAALAKFKSGGTPVTTTGSTTGGSTYTPSRVTGDISTAIKQGLGATNFAMNYADAKFGGGLDQYVTNLDAKLKKDFNLAPLETELNNLKSMRGNIIPTLENYIKGKDQYLTFVDKMIEQTEDSLMHRDMGNPAVAKSYNDYLSYLYTLKGRQNTRYSNFLNSAIDDYNSDVEKATSNYNTVYKQYEDAITRQGTMAQNEYNNLLTRMSSAYTELENAPTKAANLAILNKQAGINSVDALGNAIDTTTVTNPKYWDDVKKYTDQMTVGGTGTDKDSFNFTTMPADGLIGFYTQNVVQGGDELAMTESIRRALASTLATGDEKTATKVKKLVSDLAADPRGKSFASALSNTIIPSTSSSLTSYIQKNLPAVESAVKDLVTSGSGFLWTGIGARQAGIKDKEGWIASHTGTLSKEFLESLYDVVNANVQPGSAYEKNPSGIVSELFPAGKTDEEKAKILASGMSVI